MNCLLPSLRTVMAYLVQICPETEFFFQSYNAEFHANFVKPNNTKVCFKNCRRRQGFAVIWSNGLVTILIGMLVAVISILFYALFQTFTVGANLWLSVWSEDEEAATNTAKRNLYLGVYGALGFLQVIPVPPCD